MFHLLELLTVPAVAPERTDSSPCWPLALEQSRTTRGVGVLQKPAWELHTFHCPPAACQAGMAGPASTMATPSPLFTGSCGTGTGLPAISTMLSSTSLSNHRVSCNAVSFTIVHTPPNQFCNPCVSCISYYYTRSPR